MCVAASVLYFCNLTQKEKKKKHSSVHTAKWRTDPVCCRILRLHFALTGVQHACPPSLLDSVRVTHVRLPPARRRPAAAAGRRGQSLEPPTLDSSRSFRRLLPSLAALWQEPATETCCFPADRRHSCWTPAPSPRLQRATCSRRPASPFGFYFCFRDAEDPGRWRMRRVALPARMRTSCRSAVAELTDAFMWCRGRKSAEGRESNTECSLQKC